MREDIVVVAGPGPMADAIELVLEAAGRPMRRIDAAAALADGIPPAAAVLIDAAAGDGYGYAVLERLRGSATGPAIMLVDRFGAVEIEKARAFGAATVLTKPFTAAALLAALGPAPEGDPSRPAEPASGEEARDD